MSDLQFEIDDLRNQLQDVLPQGQGGPGRPRNTGKPTPPPFRRAVERRRHWERDRWPSDVGRGLAAFRPGRLEAIPALCRTTTRWLGSTPPSPIKTNPLGNFLQLLEDAWTMPGCSKQNAEVNCPPPIYDDVLCVHLPKCRTMTCGAPRVLILFFPPFIIPKPQNCFGWRVS